MDLQTVLNQVERWPIEERLRLMEHIWDGLLEANDAEGLTEGQRAEIDRRLIEDDATPDDVLTWEEIKADALRHASR